MSNTCRLDSLLLTEPTNLDRAVFVYWTDAHSGPGWYFYGEDYPDEGAVGAFATIEEAKAMAIKHEYRVDDA